MTVLARVLALAVAMACASVPAAAQVRQASSSLTQAKSQWLAREYGRAYTLLVQLRNSSYGRRPEVDFMLGTSACQIGRKAEGAGVLKSMLKRYALSPRDQREIARQAGYCGGPVAITPTVVVSAPPTTSGGWGKTYYWLDKQSPVSSYPARRMGDLSLEQLQQGLVNRDARDPRFPHLIKEGCQLERGDFVVVCNKNKSIGAHRLAEITREADNFVSWLKTAYGILPAEEYVTIRLVRSVDELRASARTLHKLDVSQATIGYSFADDLSATVVSQGGSGSVLHELVHLGIRRNFGDAPQWLEEGLASLYEVSVDCDGAFYGVDNWRGDLLRKHWKPEISIRSLVQQGWFETAAEMYPYRDELPVTPTMGGEQDRALGEAKMRYLAFYLQKQGRLRDLYQQLLQITPNDHYTATVDQIFERVALPYDRVDEKVQDFTKARIDDPSTTPAGACKAQAIQIRKDIPAPPRFD